MNTTTTVPTTIQLSRGRLTGLMLTAAGLAAVITWALLVFAVNRGSDTPERNVATSAYVDAVIASTPEQLAAAFGNPPVDALSYLDPIHRTYVQGILRSTPEELAAAFGSGVGTLSPYVEGIMDSTLEEIAGAFGNVQDTRSQYVQAIMNSTSGALVAAFGTPPVDALSFLNPIHRTYVQGILRSTPEELAAAFGH